VTNTTGPIIQQAVAENKPSFGCGGARPWPDLGMGETMSESVWFSRIYREFEAGNLTRAYRDVLLALGRFGACRFGIVPSHQTLAARARCCVRTVQRALEAAKALGLVSWAERRIKAAWRSLRTSNRYVLLVPIEPVRTTGQQAGGVTYERKKVGSEAEPTAPEVRRGRLEELAAIATRRMRALGLA
jgi:hypothetical protein